MYQNNKRLLTAVLVIVFIVGGMARAQAEDQLGFPAANTNVENAVPFTLIEQIALEKAISKWGPVAPGEPLPCCDDNGDIVAYMCPFRRGGEPFPAYEDILNEVKEGRKLEAALGTQSEAAPDSEDPVKTARIKMWGRETYGTVVVSAIYDHYPVPVTYHYLAPYYVKGDLAVEVAKEFLGAESVTLTRLYLLSHGHRGQYFEFESEQGTVLVHAYLLTAHLPEDVLKQTAAKAMAPADIQESVKAEWEHWKASAQN